MDKTRLKSIIAIATIKKEPDYWWGKNEVLGDVDSIIYHNDPNIGTVGAYENIYQLARERRVDVVFYVHDDVELFDEGWKDGVLSLFADPKVAIVGLGGATGMGVPDIYKVPYEITQLQRIEYYSNQRGWEIHGKREVGVRSVAVVDGFFMAVRTQFLDQVGGWKWIQSRFHCYDTSLCLAALRHGWKVQMIGIDCDHHGGGTSTKAEYVQHCREFGTTPEREHSEPHVWQYREFADLLPVRVSQ